MKIVKEKNLGQGKQLRLWEKYFMTDAGKEVVWELVERKNIYGKGAAVVIAQTKEKEIILERNWRFPIGSFVIQFPAGLTDREGESEEETARRELLEETGYQAEILIPIITTPLSPALTSTRATHFFAPQAEYIGGERKDIAEEIEVLKIPVEKLEDFLLNLPENTELDLRVPGIIWILEKKNLI